MKYKLKQITEIINGSTPSTSNSEYWDGDINWITPKDMSLQMTRYISKGERNITQKGYDSCSTTLVPKNTILLTSRAPIGYISIAQNELCTNQGFKSLVCGDKVLPLFMYYWLSTKVDFLKSISNGATFKELSKQALENIEIDLPNLETQQHIVDTIGSVDFLIEKNEEIIEELTKFSSYLIQANSKCNDNIVCCLKDIATISSGKSTQKLESGKYEIIGANGVLGYTNDFNVEDKVILTGRVGTIGTFAQYNNKIWCSDNTLIIKSKYFNYLYYFLKENFNAKSFNRGSTQPLITQSDMLKYEIKIPKNIEVLEEKLTSNYQVIENKNKENILLKKEKEILLKKYFG